MSTTTTTTTTTSNIFVAVNPATNLHTIIIDEVAALRGVTAEYAVEDLTARTGDYLEACDLVSQAYPTSWWG